MYEKTLGPGGGGEAERPLSDLGKHMDHAEGSNTRIQVRICPATFLPAANSQMATVAIGSQAITGAIFHDRTRRAIWRRSQVTGSQLGACRDIGTCRTCR